MARQVQPVITPKGPFPGTVAALALDYAFTAADASNFDTFAFTGRELILVENTTGGALTFTLESAADPQGRTGDITTYTIAATTGKSCFWAGSLIGWNQGGFFNLKGSTAGVKFAIIRIPG